MLFELKIGATAKVAVKSQKRILFSIVESEKDLSQDALKNA